MHSLKNLTSTLELCSIINYDDPMAPYPLKQSNSTHSATLDQDKANILNETFLNFFINDPPSPHPHHPLSIPMTDHLCTPEYIFDLITSLPNQTSCGHDEIPYVIKATAPSILSPLQHIFDLSISMGIFQTV